MNILVMVLLGTSLVIRFVLFLKSNNEPSSEKSNNNIRVNEKSADTDASRAKLEAKPNAKKFDFDFSERSTRKA